MVLFWLNMEYRYSSIIICSMYNTSLCKTSNFNECCAKMWLRINLIIHVSCIISFQNTNKPTQMALEPLHNQKAAVVSLFVQLPGGDEDFTPSGTSGLAIGSALISIGKYRTNSLS